MNLRKLLYFIGLPLLLLFSLPALSQQKMLSGKVTDGTGKGIAGVSVTVKGQAGGTTTSDDGSYSLSVPSNATTLVFSSVGYVAQEVSISGSTVNIAMQSASGNLNEVVVIAYGTRRKGDLTGAVTSVSAKDFQKGFIPSPEQLLQGKVAGLQITSGGGSAGGGSKIRIRGGASLNASNDPLMVIDGVPVEGNGISGTGNLLSTINPNDIESVSVLKDASATALYGSRASNGVIIITTKKGVKGKIRFNFNSQVSLSQVGKQVGVLSADQVRKIITDDAAATGSNTYKNLLGTANTNWQNEIYRKAFGNDNTISASGSAGEIPFRISLGYLNQAGVLLKNNFNRLSSSLNLSPKFFDDHLAININAIASTIKNNFSDQGAVGAAVNFDPTQPVYAAGNKYGGYFEWLQADGKPIDLANRNPLGLINLRDNTSRVNRLLGNIQLDYKMHFLPDLHVLVNLAIDRTQGKGNDNIDSLSATNYKTGGRRSFYQQGKKNTLADVQLFYSKELKSINTKFDVLVGHSYQEFLTNVYNYASFSYRAFSNPAKPGLKDTIENSTPNFATDDPKYRLESYLGRVNFTIANKYLLTASLRRDASSKFAPDRRVGYFPAVAAAWKLKEEFFRNTDAVSDLKLRLGWGVTGQQDGIPYYSYLTRYTRSNSSAQYQFGNTFYSFLRPEGYDASIKWETTTTSNIGLDFGFLNNRISGSVDFYYKKTKDLLSDVPVAPGANFVNRITTNVGNIENKGVEFSLNTTPIRQKDLTWDLGFNIAYNENKITNLLKYQDPNFKGIDVGGIGIATGNFIGKNLVGFSPNSFFVYKQVYDKTTNKPIEGLYEDINRDGKVDADDRYLYKKPAADVLLGFSTQVVYNKFSLGLAAHGMIGNYLYNQYNAGSGILSVLKNPISFIGNASVSYLETGFRNNSNNQFLSDYFIENASFLRLDNINLGYNAGRVFKDQATLRILASVQNVAIFTKYKGLDPENSSDFGIDGNIYPRPRIYSLGVNLDF